MLKKLLLTCLIPLGLFGLIYPTKKENIGLLDYCYSLEELLTSNSLEKRKNVSTKVISIAKDITKFGVNKTRGALVNKMIDQYKASRQIFIITFIPNKVYCFAGYWIEEIKPGTFEAVFYEKSREKIDELKDIKEEVDEFIKDINSEYKNIQKELNNLF